MESEGLVEVRFEFDHDGSTVTVRGYSAVRRPCRADSARGCVPHTERMPKILLPVAGRPFADLQLAWLAEHGVRKVVLSVGHLGDLIRDYVGRGERWGIDD